MKYKVTSIILTLLVSTTIFGQKIKSDKVPAAVLQAFQSKFPKAEEPKWELEDATTYEVEFEENETEFTVSFTAAGVWLETESEIAFSKLPDAVTSAIKSEYAGYKIKESEKIESAEKGAGYELELKKGKEKLEIFVDATGKIISKEIEK